MLFGSVAAGEVEGAILAHAVSAQGLVFKKGRRLSREDGARLLAAGIPEVVAARMELGDVGEDAAAARLAAAAAGTAVRVEDPFTGRANLHATAAGLLSLDHARIDRLNALDEAVTIATLPPYSLVQPGQMVATVKIIPFAVGETLLGRCLEIAGDGAPLVAVGSWRPLVAWLIQTELSGTSAKMLAKTVTVTRKRLADLGSTLLGDVAIPHRTEALAQALAEVPAEADLVLVAGASAITDRRDVLPAGIEAAGGTVCHFGMPVDPGNLILLATHRGRTVLGLPGCARSPKLNGFDWVLQRLAAGIEVTPSDVMRMGVGGLLMEIPTRPQPREVPPAPAPAAKAASGPKVAALVLAAGRSQRMGPENKLLLEIDGKPMLRRAVEAALAARLAEVVVVTGHEHGRIEALLQGMPVRLVHNPDYAQGLSTSLRTGLRALGGEVDAAVVCLGDMPRVTGRLIRRLVGAYNPVEGRAIVLPVHGGKRGNPVLWDRSFFQAMAMVEGDVGARHLIGQNQELVAEIEDEDEASLVDLDTPEAVRAYRERTA